MGTQFLSKVKKQQTCMTHFRVSDIEGLMMSLMGGQLLTVDLLTLSLLLIWAEFHFTNIGSVLLERSKVNAHTLVLE